MEFFEQFGETEQIQMRKNAAREFKVRCSSLLQLWFYVFFFLFFRDQCMLCSRRQMGPRSSLRPLMLSIKKKLWRSGCSSKKRIHSLWFRHRLNLVVSSGQIILRRRPAKRRLRKEKQKPQLKGQCRHYLNLSYCKTDFVSSIMRTCL